MFLHLLLHYFLLSLIPINLITNFNPLMLHSTSLVRSLTYTRISTYYHNSQVFLLPLLLIIYLHLPFILFTFLSYLISLIQNLFQICFLLLYLISHSYTSSLLVSLSLNLVLASFFRSLLSSFLHLHTKSYPKLLYLSYSFIDQIQISFMQLSSFIALDFPFTKTFNQVSSLLDEDYAIVHKYFNFFYLPFSLQLNTLNNHQ